ncbi:MAG: PIN domain-containing protein [Anaerolineales bacterium]|nr:PIN domain-containing protein [Anaerolineales bacterium]
MLDTNIWLERLLDQERTQEVGQLLDVLSSDQLLISDFSLHSVGVILHRLKHQRDFLTFVDDLFIKGDVLLATLRPTHMTRLVEVAHDFQLDFDDAYQYVLAELYDVPLVSFDHDFDRTYRGRIEPRDILAILRAQENEGDESE